MVGTFHSIGSKFLGWHAARKNDEDNSDFLTERMIEEFCDKLGIQKLSSSSFKTDYDDPEGTDEFSQVVSAYDMVRNRMDGSSPSDYFDSKKFDTDYVVDRLEKRFGNNPRNIRRTSDATLYAPLKWEDPAPVFTCSMLNLLIWGDKWSDVA